MKKTRLNRVKQVNFWAKSGALIVIFLLATTGSYAETNSISFDYCNFKMENNSSVPGMAAISEAA